MTVWHGDIVFVPSSSTLTSANMHAPPLRVSGLLGVGRFGVALWVTLEARQMEDALR